MWQRKSSGLVSLPDLTNFSMTALKTLLDELTQEPWWQCNQPKKEREKKKNCYFFCGLYSPFFLPFFGRLLCFLKRKEKYTHILRCSLERIPIPLAYFLCQLCHIVRKWKWMTKKWASSNSPFHSCLVNYEGIFAGFFKILHVISGKK